MFDQRDSKRKAPGPLAKTAGRASVPLAAAIAETRSVVDILDDLAYTREDMVRDVIAKGQAGVHINKGWCRPAKTYTFHTHAFAPGANRTLVRPIADLFYDSALLDEQPWYDAFVSGTSAPVREKATDHRVTSHQLTASNFHFGAGVRRTYVQLCSLVALGADRRAVVRRSVAQRPPGSEATAMAHTLAPTGDVITWRDGALHWHHIVTTTGIDMFPPFFERPLMNFLRRFGLNFSETRAYREEGRRWVYFVQDTDRIATEHQKMFRKKRR